MVVLCIIASVPTSLPIVIDGARDYILLLSTCGARDYILLLSTCAYVRLCGIISALALSIWH